MTQNRKRNRNLHEDEVEFMPLSKRINNLHINNGLFLDNTNQMGIDTEWGPGPPPPLPPNITSSTSSSTQSSSSSSQSSSSSTTIIIETTQIINHRLPETPPNSVEHSLDWNLRQYSPDLNENQNPHYFNINKLLFEMYIERVQRGCHQV